MNPSNVTRPAGGTSVARSAVRTVAGFEAFKGLLALAAAFGLLGLMHDDLGRVAETLVRHAHLDPSGRFPHAFVGWADRVGDLNAWGVFAVALVYVSMRLTEAWGLWFDRAWGEWVGTLSGAVYLPMEIHHLIHRPSALAWAVFLINVAIIALLVGRLRQRRLRAVQTGPATRA